MTKIFNAEFIEQSFRDYNRQILHFDSVDEKLEALCVWWNTLRPIRCFYCGLKLFKDKKNVGTRFYPTHDHVIPLCDGGTLTVYACQPCNCAKADMSLEEFRQFRYGDKPVQFFAESF